MIHWIQLNYHQILAAIVLVALFGLGLWIETIRLRRHQRLVRDRHLLAEAEKESGVPIPPHQFSMSDDGHHLIVKDGGRVSPHSLGPVLELLKRMK